MHSMEKTSSGETAVKISENFYWVGSYDEKLRVFDIIQETPYGTTYNSYLIVGKEKVALIETVKVQFSEEMIKRISSVLEKNNRKLDYIIHNHTEPDHSGSSAILLERFPNAIVIGSEHAVTYLKSIWPEKTNPKVLVAPTEVSSIDLGGYVLQFFSAPFLHWPDSMFTYCKELKTIFTCDFLGTHYCFKPLFNDKIPKEKEKEYLESFEYYFHCIFSPFKRYVLKGAKIFQDIMKNDGIEIVATSHGPILRTGIKKMLEKYIELSSDGKREEKVTILYCSAYGYTKEIADGILDGIKKENVPVKIFDVTNASDSEILKEIQSSKGVLFGSPTILGDVLPNILKFLVYPYVNPIINQNQITGSFGSYGWSGEATGVIDNRLEQLKLKIPLNPLKIRFKPNKKDIENCVKFGGKFARSVKGEEINERTKKKKIVKVVYPTDGKLRLWKCIICGEIIQSKLPPNICPACNADGDIWICIKVINENDAKKTDYSGTVAVIGGGTAGIASVKAMRRKNDKARIILFSEEGFPYYRPSVTKGEFRYVCKEEWFKENNVELVFEKVVDIIYAEKKIVTEKGKEFNFDRVILAMGSQANNFFCSAKNVFTIYTPKDIEKILNWINKKDTKIVIVGAGLMGIEISDLLLEKKKELIGKITFVEFLDRIMPKQLDVEASAIIRKMLEDDGLKLRLNTCVDKFVVNSDNIAEKVTFKNLKDVEECDMIIVTVGTKNNLELVEKLKLNLTKRKNRVVVNEFMETSLKDVYAAGNIAQCGFFAIPNYANANTNGEIAGLNCVEFKKKYKVVFTPFTVMYKDFHCCSCGKNFTGTFLTKKNDEEYIRMSFKDGKLCGIVSVDKKKDMVKLNRAMQAKYTIPEAVEAFFS